MGHLLLAHCKLVRQIPFRTLKATHSITRQTIGVLAGLTLLCVVDIVAVDAMQTVELRLAHSAIGNIANVTSLLPGFFRKMEEVTLLAQDAFLVLGKRIILPDAGDTLVHLTWNAEILQGIVCVLRLAFDALGKVLVALQAILNLARFMLLASAKLSHPIVTLTDQASSPCQTALSAILNITCYWLDFFFFFWQIKN